MSDNHESEDKPAWIPHHLQPTVRQPPSRRRPPPRAGRKVAALEVEKAELKDRMLRIAAEFENYKKRTRKEMSEHEPRRGSGPAHFLDIADNLQRAITSWTEGGEKDVKSVRMASSWSCASSSRSWNAMR